MHAGRWEGILRFSWWNKNCSVCKYPQLQVHNLGFSVHTLGKVLKGFILFYKLVTAANVLILTVLG